MVARKSDWGNTTTPMQHAEKRIVVLDTSYHMHFLRLDGVDWPNVVNANAVEIVFPPVAIQELDKLKDFHSDKKMRGRAGDILSFLDQKFTSGTPAHIRDGVKVRLEPRRPQIDYAAQCLDKTHQDDNFIASILDFAGQSPGLPIVLVTGDYGLRWRCESFGIRAIKPPNEVKRPPEVDPIEKDYQRLK